MKYGWEKEIRDAGKAVNGEFKALLKRQDFTKKLEEAIGNDICMTCNGLRVLKSLGLCGECAQFLDKKLEKKLNDKYEIEAYMTVNVKKRI